MSPTQINGLPAHILLVHVVVILVPLTALAVVAFAAWPAARNRLGVVAPLLALVALISVPVTTHAGEWLEGRLPSTALIRKHTDLGDGLLPWAFGLFVIAAVLWFRHHREAPRASVDEPSSHRRGGANGGPVQWTLIALSVVIAVGSVVQVYRIGDSGAKAAWTGVGTQVQQGSASTP